jgi:hypothetical protein
VTSDDPNEAYEVVPAHCKLALDATDTWSNTATSTRTVIVQTASSSSSLQ